MLEVLQQKINRMSTKQTIYYLSTKYSSWFQTLKVKKESTIKMEEDIKKDFQNCLYFNNKEDAEELCSTIKKAIYSFYKGRDDCPNFVKAWISKPNIPNIRSSDQVITKISRYSLK